MHYLLTSILCTQQLNYQPGAPHLRYNYREDPLGQAVISTFDREYSVKQLYMTKIRL